MLEYIYTSLYLRWNTFRTQLPCIDNCASSKTFVHWNIHTPLMDQYHGQYWPCIVVHQATAIYCNFVIILWRNGKCKSKIFLVSWYGKETISPTSQANCQFVQSVQNIMYMSQFPVNNTSLTSLNIVQYCSTPLTNTNIVQVSISENTPITLVTPDQNIT